MQFELHLHHSLHWSHISQAKSHAQLLNCVESMLDISQEDISEVSQPMFNLLITMLALKQDQDTENKVWYFINICASQEFVKCPSHKLLAYANSI